MTFVVFWNYTDIIRRWLGHHGDSPFSELTSKALTALSCSQLFPISLFHLHGNLTRSGLLRVAFLDTPGLVGDHCRNVCRCDATTALSLFRSLADCAGRVMLLVRLARLLNFRLREVGSSEFD